MSQILTLENHIPRFVISRANILNTLNENAKTKAFYVGDTLVVLCNSGLSLDGHALEIPGNVLIAAPNGPIDIHNLAISGMLVTLAGGQCLITNLVAGSSVYGISEQGSHLHTVNSGLDIIVKAGYDLSEKFTILQQCFLPMKPRDLPMIGYGESRFEELSEDGKEVLGDSHKLSDFQSE